MNTPDEKLWAGLSADARAALATRDYASGSFAEQLSRVGIEAGKLLAIDRNSVDVREAWIPGVEFFPRAIYPQRHRGFFGEFARRDEGAPAAIGFWPAQWATARMFANTAKGFHIHPPSIPDGPEPAAWFRRLFVEEPRNFALRPYDREQW